MPRRGDLDIYRTGKAYTITQASRLARTTPQTVRRWLFGDRSPERHMRSVFARPAPEEGERAMISFLELIEIVIAARWRHGSIDHPPVPLDRIRKAHAFAREQLGLQYPFASLKLRVEGPHIMHEFDRREPDEPRMALDLNGQLELPGLVRAELDHLEFERDTARDPFAIRWFPCGPKVPIVVDPYIAGGRPTIFQTGITVATVRSRHKAGESIEDIAYDYELPGEVIEQVLKNAA